MAYLAAPLQGTGANAPQGTLSALVTAVLQQGPLDADEYTTFMSSVNIITPGATRVHTFVA